MYHLGLDNIGQQLRLIAVHHHHLAAAQQGGEGEIVGPHVKQRRPGHEGILRGRPHLGAVDAGARDYGAVADQGALWQTGGAGGEDDDQAVLATHRRFRLPGGGRGQGGLVVGPDGQIIEIIHQPRLGNQHFWLGQLNTVMQLERREAPVQGHRDGADFGRGHGNFHVFQAIMGQQANPVARVDTLTPHDMCQAVNAFVQLAVCSALIIALQGNGIGVQPSLTGEHPPHVTAAGLPD